MINEHNSQVTENSLHLEWAARSLDCVDFFIVEMAVLHNSVVRVEPEEFQEVFRGSRTKFESRNLPYNSEVSCRIFSVNGKGRSEISPLYKGSTCRGMFVLALRKTLFQFRLQQMEGFKWVLP